VPALEVPNASGRVIWGLGDYAFLEGDCPDTVHPSLWRNARLNMRAGLFEVVPGVYQVRGFDISNMSLIETATGVVVVDPLISVETAAAALALYRKHRGARPVVAVMYTHSHVDHFGGVRGVIEEAEVAAGRVAVIAPEGFLEHAVSENLFAGPAMGRRAGYMYGALLPKGPRGQVDAGIGKGTSLGTLSLIAPTDLIRNTGDERLIDGVRFVFQLAPGTEAPAEMHFHLPHAKALHLSENTNATLHNLYTLRGAQVRDAKAWAYYLREALKLHGDDSEVLFSGHFWPRWGRDAIDLHVNLQADVYQYIHDQTLRLANHGLTMNEIAEQLELPDELGLAWCNRGYYGTVSHNAKAVYQRYLGFFDGNPAHLQPHPPEESGRRYVEFMGGADAVVDKARASFEAGDYRWVAEVLSHVVFALPSHVAARALAADALEQLGYQSESSVWRNFYLSGAQEMREGVPKRPTRRGFAPDMAAAMTPAMFFDFMAARLNGPKAAGRRIDLAFDFTDTGERFAVSVRRAVLVATPGAGAVAPQATFSMARRVLYGVAAGAVDGAEAIAQGKLLIDGDATALRDFMALFDTFDPWFAIATP
jgi:alkyl sulfatase BDS1-like metallo-beta-lactamase superfamily hydrolase